MGVMGKRRTSAIIPDEKVGVKEIREVRDKEKVNGSDLDPVCPY